jgi:hypothetical protein
MNRQPAGVETAGGIFGVLPFLHLNAAVNLNVSLKTNAMAASGTEGFVEVNRLANACLVASVIHETDWP